MELFWNRPALPDGGRAGGGEEGEVEGAPLNRIGLHFV